MISPYFLKMIQTLREKEEIMLYGNILHTSEEEKREVISFLKSEYERESTGYPYETPLFSEAAALWAANTIYIASQLILYRENKGAEVELLLPKYLHEENASAALSADLCLRFLPSMIIQLKVMDPEDLLIGLLENVLHTWHYSGVNYSLEVEKIDFTTITSDRCLHQSYVNRVIENKKIKLAMHPACRDLVLASLGDHGQKFWKEFKTEISIHE